MISTPSFVKRLSRGRETDEPVPTRPASWATESDIDLDGAMGRPATLLAPMPRVRVVSPIVESFSARSSLDENEPVSLADVIAVLDRRAP